MCSFKAVQLEKRSTYSNNNKEDSSRSSIHHFIYLQVDSGSPAYPRSIAEWWFDCKELNRAYLTLANGTALGHLGEKSRRDVEEVSDEENRVVDIRSGLVNEEALRGAEAEHQHEDNQHHQRQHHEVQHSDLYGNSTCRPTTLSLTSISLFVLASQLLLLDRRRHFSL